MLVESALIRKAVSPSRKRSSFYKSHIPSCFNPKERYFIRYKRNLRICSNSLFKIVLKQENNKCILEPSIENIESELIIILYKIIDQLNDNTRFENKILPTVFSDNTVIYNKKISHYAI